MTREHHDQGGQRRDDALDIMGPMTAPTQVSADAARAIQDFAQNGKGNAKDIPPLMRRIGPGQKGDVVLDFPALAPRMSGKLFLECCATLGYWPRSALELAMKTSPAATDAEIGGYLQGLSVSAALELEDDEQLIARLRVLLPGSMIRHLPQLNVAKLEKKPHLLTWFIDSTPVEVAAVELARHGTEDLARTLDAINRWSWLDHLHSGAAHWGQVRELKFATTNANAKTRLAEITKGYSDTPMDTAEITEIESGARASLNAHIEDPSFTNAQLVDATARANGIEGQPTAEMNKRMRGQPAADLLQYAIASGEPAVKRLELMLTAPDITYEHVLGFLRRFNDAGSRAELLGNDSLRPKLRKVIGRSTSLLDLHPLQVTREALHPYVVKDEALLAWAMESKEPRDMLWVAAGSALGERRGLREVKELRGLDWIMKLPADVPGDELRRLSFIVSGKHKKHVDELLGDRPITHAAGSWETEAIDPKIKNQDDVTQFHLATRLDTSTEQDIMGRLSDLEPNERRDVAKDPEALQAALVNVSGENLMRAVAQLQPTIAQLLGTKLQNVVELLAYLRTRPPGEELEAASSAALTKRAAELFRRSPFDIFPALLQPAALAGAIDKNPTLLEWIFNDAEPNQALAILSKDPVKAKAIDALESLEDPMTRFPRYKHLLPEGRAGIDVIAKGVSDEDTKKSVDRYQHGKGSPEPEVRNDGKHVHDAAASAHLWDAIDTLKEPDPNTLLALIRAYPGEHLALLDGKHERAVGRLREILKVGPQVVFPEIRPVQLMAKDSGRRWLLAQPSFIGLNFMAKDAGALKLLGSAISSSEQEATSWVVGLPRGAGLDAAERAALDTLRAHVTTAEGLRLLFRARFDITVEDTFDAQRTTDLWNALRRLPPAHVNQKTIEGFTREKLTNPGYWGDPNVVMTTNEAQLEQPDVSYENTPALSKAKLMTYYGLDEAAFQKAIDPTHGWIEAVDGNYKVKSPSLRTFESTVLHEVGHAIDTLLGTRTELVFGIAGWKNYGIDQIEEWAKDMGALDGVSGKQKEQIVEAWRHAVRSQTTIADIVPPEHPAMDKKLAHVPLVKAALEGHIFSYKEKRQVGNRVGLTGTNQGTIGSVPIATADVAPSQYSLSAPGEFFAECYVEYYRDFDGTAQTAAKKGGRLPPAYRKWFDDNVDKIELNPQRYHKDDDGGGAAAPGGNSASGGTKPNRKG